MDDRLQISKVLPEDAEEIHAILESWLLFNRTGTEHGSGFLIAPYNKNHLRHFASLYEYFIKAVDSGGNIAGVVIGCKSEHISPGDTKYSLVKYSLNKPFVIVKQVFASPGQTGRYVCSRLYGHLFSIIPSDRPVAAIIVKNPPNEASFRFHARNGFTEYLNFRPDSDSDGIPHLRSVWIRPAATSESYLDDVRFTNVI